MYHPSVVERRVEKLEADTGTRLIRNPVSKVVEWVEHLAKLYDPEQEALKRALRPEEKAFIRNERLMGALDWLYWAERYAFFIPNEGGLRRFTLWDSQRVLLDIIAKLEQEQWDASSRGESVDGICLAAHKARQLGATTLLRVLIMHRLVTTPYTRALTASVNDEKVDALALRDKRIVENLPWWLLPETGYDVKGKHRTFSKLDCSLVYQDYGQMSGLGQGEQFEMGHLTEAGVITDGTFIENHYFPTIPMNPLALHVFESTAQGRGNWWHHFVMELDRGGSRRWKLVFIPWYTEVTKYRATPPDGWQPNELSLMHAQIVHDTSQRYVGHPVMLTKEQLYWWETERADYQRKGSLHIFLTNYPSTLEESFQHTTQSAFSPELLADLRDFTATRQPLPLEFHRGGAA